MNILENIMLAIQDQPELTFFVLSSFGLLITFLILSFKFAKGKQKRYLMTGAAILLLLNMVMSLPVFMRMFFK